MAFRHWRDLSSRALSGLDPERTLVVLPLASTEQHGPHLPTGTDAFIAEGLIAAASAKVPDDLDVLVLPVQAVGASLEHSRFPGTLSLSAAELIAAIVAVGGGVAASGLKKLVLVSSHGGNVSAMNAGALECRARRGLLAVTLTWARLGLPEGLVSDAEQAHGIHGGLVETSLMLHFRPDLVEMPKAELFPSAQATLAEKYKMLRAHGPVGFGWMSGDLNPDGVMGDAAGASAEIGAAIAAHQAAAFLELLAEVAAAETAELLSGS